MCVFSFVRQKMNDERNLIFDVCVFCVNETNFFFAREKTKAKKHTRLFSFLFFFFSHKSFLSFFSQTSSNVDASNAPNFSHKLYLLVHRKQTLFRFENAREHRFISPSKEGCGVGTLSSVDTPSFNKTLNSLKSFSLCHSGWSSDDDDDDEF